MLVVVIPTRNRSQLAQRALESVLSQGAPVAVFVSDNSTSEEHSATLRAACGQYDSNQVRYARPPSSLIMVKHWQWALEQARREFDGSHITVLTDRMVFARNVLPKLSRIMLRYPTLTISYNHDRIDDDTLPVRLEQVPWTGRVYGLDSAELLRLASQLRLLPVLPRLLNCVTPFATLEALNARYGPPGNSISPDYMFCFRVLGQQQHIGFWDYPALVHYAASQSNGASYARGSDTATMQDFKAHVRRESNQPMAADIEPWRASPELNWRPSAMRLSMNTASRRVSKSQVKRVSPGRPALFLQACSRGGCTHGCGAEARAHGAVTRAARIWPRPASVCADRACPAQRTAHAKRGHRAAGRADAAEASSRARPMGALWAARTAVSQAAPRGE